MGLQALVGLLRPTMAPTGAVVGEWDNYKAMVDDLAR